MGLHYCCTLALLPQWAPCGMLMSFPQTQRKGLDFLWKPTELISKGTLNQQQGCSPAAMHAAGCVPGLGVEDPDTDATALHPLTQYRQKFQ